MRWRNFCNCDNGHRRAYALAAKDVGLGCRIGPPNSLGVPSCMSGVYIDADAPPDLVRKFEDRIWVRRSEWENDPFKQTMESPFAGMPTWLKTAWLVCGILWVVWVFAILAR